MLERFDRTKAVFPSGTILSGHDLLDQRTGPLAERADQPADERPFKLKNYTERGSQALKDIKDHLRQHPNGAVNSPMGPDQSIDQVLMLLGDNAMAKIRQGGSGAITRARLCSEALAVSNHDNLHLKSFRRTLLESNVARPFSMVSVIMTNSHPDDTLAIDILEDIVLVLALASIKTNFTLLVS